MIKLILLMTLMLVFSQSNAQLTAEQQAIIDKANAAANASLSNLNSTLSNLVNSSLSNLNSTLGNLNTSLTAEQQALVDKANALANSALNGSLGSLENELKEDLQHLSSETHTALTAEQLAIKEANEKIKKSMEDLAEAVEKRKDAQKHLIDAFKANLTASVKDQVQAFKQLVNTGSMDPSLLETANQQISQLLQNAMNDQNETDARSNIAQLIQLQKTQARIQLDDFKKGAFSLNQSELDSFQDSAKASLQAFKHSVEAFAKISTEDGEMDQDSGIFAKKVLSKMFNDTDIVSLGFNGADSKGRKADISFPGKGFNRFNGNGTKNISAVSAFVDRQQVESFVAGILGDLVEMSLVDASGNPINVADVLEGIQILIPKNASDSSSMTNKQCFYLDPTTHLPKTDGVNCQGIVKNSAGQDCYSVNTTHLSTFGVQDTTATLNTYAPPDTTFNLAASSNTNISLASQNLILSFATFTAILASVFLY